MESYRAILHKAGYEVEAAYDGESGLAKAKKLQPDLIILDVMMAHATEGFEVAHTLKHDDALQHIPILMVTSIGSESSVKDSVEGDEILGAVDAFIEKPVAPHSLLASVKKLLLLVEQRCSAD